MIGLTLIESVSLVYPDDPKRFQITNETESGTSLLDVSPFYPEVGNIY